MEKGLSLKHFQAVLLNDVFRILQSCVGCNIGKCFSSLVILCFLFCFQLGCFSFPLLKDNRKGPFGVCVSEESSALGWSCSDSGENNLKCFLI